MIVVIGKLLLAFVILYIWNILLVKPLMTYFIDHHVKKTTEINDFNRFFGSWMVTHKVKFIKMVQGFYWLAFPFICYQEISLYFNL